MVAYKETFTFPANMTGVFLRIPYDGGLDVAAGGLPYRAVLCVCDAGFSAPPGPVYVTRFLPTQYPYCLYGPCARQLADRRRQELRERLLYLTQPRASILSERSDARPGASEQRSVISQYLRQRDPRLFISSQRRVVRSFLPPVFRSRHSSADRPQRVTRSVSPVTAGHQVSVTGHSGSPGQSDRPQRVTRSV